MAQRDNFTESTKALLAKRVGYLCSHPECKRLTIGPALGEEAPVNIGEAAHITAAAAGGPRYDASLSTEERRSYTNGIWLCGVHAKQVDSDEKQFTVDLLRDWKRTAEQVAFDALTSGNPRVLPIVKLNLESEVLEVLGLSKEEDVEKLTARLRKAATSDLGGFKAAAEWPTHAIALSLRRRGSDAPAFHVEACAAGIVGSELSLVAPPGTGKSTTLVQLAEKILASEQRVAVFVPLNEWSNQSDNILASLTHRAVFREFSEKDFLLLALNGRLALLLDGWNELDADSRKRAISELKRLRRDFPLLQIAISTRRQALDVPISGPTIEIQPLSEDQQLEIAKATSGGKGEILLDRAWRVPGLRALVSIPLYLRALLNASPDGGMPTTKEEVLRLFVAEHELSPQNAEVLHTELHDLQEEILTTLAVEATTSANTLISESRSRSVIAETTGRLASEGQIKGRLQPMNVIDSLVSHHVLVRREGKSEISFQHQQIQEWYSSFYVENLMVSAAAGDADAAAKLRVNVLNMPAWEEAILFSCERLSRRDQSGAAAVADGILESLKIDPMLAAEMIYRSAPPVWERIKETIIEYVGRWHTRGKVDRAVRFMITTGKPEFAPFLWPLIANADSQVYLAAFRAAERFRPMVLGEDVRGKLSELPDEIRDHIIAQFAWESGIDGMELAAEVAKTDPLPQVQFAVIEALQFRSCDRLVKEMLKTAPPTVWSLLAQKGYAREIRDPEAAARLREEERSIIENDPNPLRRLEYLARSGAEGDKIAGAIETLISSTDFPMKEQNGRWLLVEISKRWPAAVASGLVRRLANGLAIPFGSVELLTSVPIVDDGPIAAIVTNPESPTDIAGDAVTLVGPKSIGILIDQLHALGGEVRSSGGTWSEAQSKRAHHLRDLIARSRQKPFIEAWLTRSETEDPHSIATLADLVAAHGRGEIDTSNLRLDEPSRSSMIAACRHHADALLESPKATRHQLSELARAIGRLGVPELTNVVGQLCAEDLRRWRIAREERARNPIAARGNDASMAYTRTYSSALAAIGDDKAVELLKGKLADPLFGQEAALALRQIWERQHTTTPAPKTRLLSGPDFSQVKIRRAERRAGLPEQCQLGEAIFAVAEDLAKPSRSEAEQRHALGLATVEFTMPYANKNGLIKLLLALKLPLLEKRNLLVALTMAGEIISADLELEGIRAFLEAAKQKSWMLHENGLWELKEWLRLVPFSDRPAAILEAIDLVPKNLLHRWNLRGVLSSLANTPDADAERILGELAKRDPDLIGEYEWVDAVLGRATNSAYLMVFDSFCDPNTAAGKRVERYVLTDKLGEIIGKRPDLRSELLRRYEDPELAHCHPMIEEVLAKSPDERVVLAMVRSYSKRGKPFDRTLRAAIEGVALGRRSAPGWQGAYETYRVAVPELRRKLFAMTGDNSEEGRLAAACLTAIDELRDEYGYIDSEPRHPGI